MKKTAAQKLENDLVDEYLREMAEKASHHTFHAFLFGVALSLLRFLTGRNKGEARIGMVQARAFLAAYDLHKQRESARVAALPAFGAGAIAAALKARALAGHRGPSAFAWLVEQMPTVPLATLHAALREGQRSGMLDLQVADDPQYDPRVRQFGIETDSGWLYFVSLLPGGG